MILSLCLSLENLAVGNRNRLVQIGNDVADILDAHAQAAPAQE
jgi:hypothetical protein